MAMSGAKYSATHVRKAPLIETDGLDGRTEYTTGRDRETGRGLQAGAGGGQRDPFVRLYRGDPEVSRRDRAVELAG